MENYDEIFDNGTYGSAQPRLSTEEWIEMKKQERAELYAAIDDMAEKALCDKEALSTYLTLQANLGRTSVNNTLLVMAQKPDATFVCDAEVWQERGRSIRKGEGKNAIKQFMQDREYTREDGSIAMGYKVVRCFDISQTYGKPVSQRAALSMPMKSKLKALMTDAPVPVKLSDEVPQSIGAQYSPKENVIHVAKGLNGGTLFYSISREMARSDGCPNTFLCDCAANIACIRFGIAPKFCDQIPEEYANLDTQEKRTALGEIRSAAIEMIGRVDKNLYAIRQQQKNQPER